jgi:hypothetical protein
MRNFILSVALILGVVFNLTIASAQSDTIRSLDPAYQYGVEKYTGEVVPQSGQFNQFGQIGFVTPPGAVFTESSYAFKSGQYFSILVPEITPSADTLLLAFKFQANSPVTSYVDVYDTLVISADNAEPFILPVRGTLVPYKVAPLRVTFPYYVVPKDSSELLPLNITTVNPAGFSYTLGLGAASPFIVEDTTIVPGTVSVITLQLQFIAPPNPTPAEYLDTLTIANPAFPNRVFNIPLSAHTTDFSAIPSTLFFGKQLVDSTETLLVKISTGIEVEPEDISIVGNPDFTFVLDNWTDKGGNVYVSFKPQVAGSRTARLYLQVDSTYVFNVPLSGVGQNRPVLSAYPDTVNFGTVTPLTTVFSTVTVVQTYPINRLDESNFTIEDDEYGVFSLESVVPGPYLNPDTVVVTLAFTPASIGGFSGTLVVHADYAEDDLSIPLVGVGYKASAAPQLSPQQATGVSAVETHGRASLQVNDGDIVVSGAPAGSAIQVYNLLGQTLKTQVVASDKETLKTDAFPKSVYIVVVNDREQVILKQKVVF